MGQVQSEVESSQPHHVTFDAVRKAAIRLENVTEGTSYGTPGFFVGKKLFLRWRPEIDSLVLRVDFERRAEMMAAEPETYYITDHNVAYELVLARLARLGPDTIEDLLRMAWKAAGGPAATIPRKRASDKKRTP